MNPALRLYRRILKLHKNLPLTSKALGDQYLKDEFRRHKNATQEQITEFIQEWKVSLKPRFKYISVILYKTKTKGIMDKLQCAGYVQLYLGQ